MLTVKKLNGFKILSMSVLLLFTVALTLQADNHQMLKDKIQNALMAEGYSDITVKIQEKNDVRLEGKVDFLSDKYRIYDIAAKFPKVKELTVAVVVETENRPDDAIKSDIKDVYQTLYRIKDPEDIQVEVDNGIVKLNGSVEYYRVKLMAEKAASWIYGVKGVINDIKVEAPEGKITDIKNAELGSISDLVSELLLNWYSQEDDVRFTVKDNDTVRLEGKVSSLWIKKSLAKDVGKILGVTEVVNDLEVK